MSIYTIVITYNATRWIDKCFFSLRNSNIPVNTIVVDNNSTDDTVTIIKEKFPEVTLIESTKNLGFGKGNNIGINFALTKNPDYIFLLNQDAWIFPDTIEKLISIKVSGILCPIQLNTTGNGFARGFSFYISKLYENRVLDDFLLQRETNFYEVSFVNAAAWFIPIETFRIIGGFDPIFFHYGEDYNYGQRLKYHGMSFYIVPGSFVIHDAKMDGKSDFFLSQETRHDFLLLYANVNKIFPSYYFFACHYNFFKRLLINLSNLRFDLIKYSIKDCFFLIRNGFSIYKSRITNKEKGMNWLSLKG